VAARSRPEAESRVLKRVFLALTAALLLWLGWELVTFPDTAKLAKEPPETTAFMELRKRELRRAGKDDTIVYTWVPYGRISPYLRRAVLVAEDNSFYDHEGVDTKGMREAFERNLKRRKVTHGGSTITQQLAKNLYLSPSRNPLRKVREYFIARSLEKNLTKKRILEIYLNVVEYGERVYGAEAAARHYFDKPASSLTTSQAALLAGCLPNPRIMNPGNPNKRLRARQKMILSRMKRWGYLAEREVLTEPKKKEADAPTETVAPTDTSTTAPAEPVDPDLTPETGTDTAEEVPDAPATETVPPAETAETETTATTGTP
jgi:monofunctional biosynthetic peptidoglycan transglycosylase